MIMDVVAKAGGLFATLTFIHFLVDWVFQTHDEAMRKSKESHIRARHCIIYMVGFLPLLILTLKAHLIYLLICCTILFLSHFFEDTYAPVVYWFLKIRRPPQLIGVKYKDAEKPFVEYITNNGPLPYILLIVIDQIIHLFFLWPIIYLMMTC